MPKNHFNGVAFENFAKLVGERTKGQIKIEVYHDALLIPGNQILDAVSKGKIEMGFLSESYYTGTFPVLNYGSVPYMFDGYEHIKKAIPGMLKVLAPFWKEKNIVEIGLTPGGFNGYASKSKLYKVPGDMKGKNVRTYSKATARMVELSGGSPVNMGGDEVYLALQRGVVDATYMPPTSIAERKLYEVTSYYSYCVPATATLFIAVSLDIWNKLSKDLQDILYKTAEEAITEALIVEIPKDLEKSFDVLRKNKMEVYFPTPQDKEQWNKIFLPLKDDFVSEAGPLGKELLQAIDAARK